MASINMMQLGAASSGYGPSGYDPASMSRVAIDDEIASGGSSDDVGVDDDGTIIIEDELGLYPIRDVRVVRGWRCAACVTLCMGALIGTAVAVGLSAGGSHAKVDEEYSAGTVGETTPSILPSPPHNLDQMCAAASLATPMGHVACVDLCQAAACCTLYPDGDPLSCLSGNEDACAEYETACLALELNGGGDAGTDAEIVELPPPPADLINACSQSSVATVDGFGACEEACRLARWCCGSDGSDGTCTSREYCSQYEGPCSTIGSFPSGPYVVATTTTTRATTTTATTTSSTVASTNADDTMALQELLQVAEEIVTKCSEGSLNTETGRAECRSLCHSHLCCFDDDPKYSCQNDDARHCAAYAGCENLVSTDPLYTDNSGG